ncbi:hypothetical protein [Streptomyces sp. NPDC048641]|uniref:hypothetical protein n=1 Tax=Streptomyces sp. NPDC048641 TaxID=3154825 RepID=UPI003447ED76
MAPFAAPPGQSGQPPVPPLAPPTAPPPPAFAPGGPSPVGAFFGRAFRGDWAGSAQAALWPVGLLVIAAVALAIPSYGQGSDVVVGFGDRMRIALALLLQSLGGGFEVSASGGSSPFGGSDSPFGGGGGDMGTELSGGAALSLVPLTVTVLWILALWIGVRVLRSRLQARAAAPDGPTPVPGTPGLEAALRVALLVTVCVLVLGLFAQPSIQGVSISSSPVLAALGALLISLAVAAGMLHRDDLAQWLAVRPGVRALVRATGTALRALAVVLVICSLAAFISIAQIDGLGDASDVSDVSGLGQADLSPLVFALLVLPNLGAMALGLGWGAPISLEAGGSSTYGGGYQHQSFGLSELGDVTNAWAVVGALALGTVCALTVGVMAARRSADRREQFLSAGIFLGLFLLLGALGGLGVQATGAASDLGGSGTGSAGVGLGMAEVLLFGLLWVFAAAFLAPYLMQMAGVRTGIVPEPQLPPGAFGPATPGVQAPGGQTPGVQTPGVPAPVAAMPEAPAGPPAPIDPPSPAVAAVLPTATAAPTSTPTPPPGPTPGPTPDPAHASTPAPVPAPMYDPHTFQLGAQPAAVPAKSPRRAGVWVATIAGAFVIGGGVAAGVLLLQDNGGKDDKAGADDKPPVSTGQPATSQQPTSAPTPTPTPTPSATPDQATAPTPSATPDATVPSGYRKVADPMGFSFVIPDVWSRQGVENGSQITYAGSTGAEHYLIGVIPNAGYTSYDNILNMEKHAKEDRKKQDYQRIDLRSNTFQGRPGAIWEYTYRDEGGRTMHGIDQSYIAEDGTEYTIFLVGQQDVWADLKKTYRTGLESWRLTY